LQNHLNAEIRAVFGNFGDLRSVDIVKAGFKFTGWCTHPIEMIYEVILRRVLIRDVHTPCTLSAQLF
jgi:hypothetical protein